MLVTSVAQASDACTLICQQDCPVVAGDYTLSLPDIDTTFTQVTEPSLEGTLTGLFVDDNQTIIYQATARGRYGNRITLTVIQRENATAHFGELDVEEFRIVAYAATSDWVGKSFQSLIWVDYIDPDRDRHIAVVIETSSKYFDSYSDSFWDSAVSLN